MTLWNKTLCRCGVNVQNKQIVSQQQQQQLLQSSSKLKSKRDFFIRVNLLLCERILVCWSFYCNKGLKIFIYWIFVRVLSSSRPYQALRENCKILNYWNLEANNHNLCCCMLTKAVVLHNKATDFFFPSNLGFIHTSLLTPSIVIKVIIMWHCSCTSWLSFLISDFWDQTPQN